VKILQAVCLSQPRSAIVPDLCNILSTKLKDENDNIKVLPRNFAHAKLYYSAI